MSTFESNCSEKPSVNFEEWLQLAEEGNAEAQNIVGAFLVTGYYVEQDVLGGFYWYCQAIKQGYVHAKWNAGSMLIDGDEGIEKNEELGLRLITEAAEANENSACLFISDCYLSGLYGKDANKELAEYWEHRAWDYNNAKEFDRPVDIENEYKLELKKPELLRKIR